MLRCPNLQQLPTVLGRSEKDVKTISIFGHIRHVIANGSQQVRLIANSLNNHAAKGFSLWFL